MIPSVDTLLGRIRASGRRLGLGSPPSRLPVGEPASGPPPPAASAESHLAAARASRTDRDAIRAICERALREAPDDLRNLVDIGSVARDAEMTGEAEAVFGHILARDREYRFALYELAMTQLLARRHPAALATVDRLLALAPEDARARLLAARLAFALGDIDGGEARLAPLPADTDPETARMAAVLRAFGRFMARHPQSAVMRLCTGFELGPRYLDAHGVFERAMAALREGRPFSLVRVGDGEGAFLHLSDAEEAEFAALHAYNRADRARVWFADTIDLAGSGFEDAAFGIGEAIRDADVVGLPYTDWFRHDYRVISMTGISSLANALRFAETIPGALCAQTVHTRLQTEGLLARLLDGQTRIGLISCHRELPAMLAAAFGFAEVRYHYVPGEKGHRHLVEASATEGEHWPDHYRQTMAALDAPLDGIVYLVAAGILGKLYCQRIKARGGVALDIGSVADGWVGVRTRPGLDRMELRP